jgi:hypothetical protein
MMKSLTLLTATLAAGLVVVSEVNARPGLSLNGRNLNGVSENGRNLNGTQLNGAVRDDAVAGQDVHAMGIILKDGARVTLK